MDIPEHAFRTGKLAQALDATHSMSWAKNLEIGNIARLEDFVGRSEHAEETIIGGRAFDEIVADGVELMVRAGMAADQASHAPVIDDIVDVLDRAFGFWIAAVIMNPEIVAEGDVRH